MGGGAADGEPKLGRSGLKGSAKQPLRVAFGRVVGATVAPSHATRRIQRQTARVREKLLRSFELERHRIATDNAVSANTTRKALRESKNTIELRKALDIVEERGQVSSLGLLQMQCAYMDSPGWLEAQMATDRRTDERLAEYELRQVQKVQVRLGERGHKHKGVRHVKRSLIAILKQHMGHVPLPECLRRWRLYARTSRTLRIHTEKTIRQTDAIMSERATRMKTWQARAKMCTTASATASTDGEVASFAIGNVNGDADAELPQPDIPEPPTKFPSSELQLQVIAYRHASPGRQRKVAALLRRNTRNELLHRCICHADDVASVARTWLEQNGVVHGAAGERLNFVAQVPTVVSALHPPARSEIAGSEQAEGGPEISVVFKRPVRLIDEAVLQVAISEYFGNDGAQSDAEIVHNSVSIRNSSHAWQHTQKQEQTRNKNRQTPSLIQYIGMRFDPHCEELLEIIDGSAAAETSRVQPVFRPGLFLTHIQGTVIRSVAVDTAKPTSIDKECVRIAQVTQVLAEALDSGEPLLFGFTSKPLHVYRVLREGVVATTAVAAASMPRPTPPTSPSGRSRPSSPVHIASRPASAASFSHTPAARPRSANVTTRPLGMVCHPKRPVSARPDCDCGTRCSDHDARADMLQSPTGFSEDSAARLAMAAHQEQEPTKCDQLVAAPATTAQRQRPATAPPSRPGKALISSNNRNGRSLRLLGTFTAADSGESTWSYADYTSASVNSTGAPGVVDKQALASSIGSSTLYAKTRPDLVQKQKQRERQWHTGRLLWREQGHVLRVAASISNHISSTAASPREANKRQELFKWDTSTECARRGSKTGEIIRWSNQAATAAR